jgi:arylsulfatase A-like enzyme
MRTRKLLSRLKAGTLAALLPLSLFAEVRPNIVYILADDMGYSDVQCLNPERGKIKTPHLDQLAADGMVFTDAHSGSSVCTPTRHGIITGRYSWRSRLQKGVTNSYGRALIPTSRATVASILREQGYNTAMIGKWHIGMNLPTLDDKPLTQKGLSNVDWERRIEGGPFDLGFDYYFGISATLDMPPYIYIENDQFDGECTTIKRFPRPGAAHEDFEAIDVLDDLAEKAVAYIKSQSAAKPFFTYIALPSPHTPIVPTPEWQGKSEVGKYGDFQMQTDAFVGTIMDAVAAVGLAENTLFIVTSDNGCSKAAGIAALETKGHFPSAQFRGSKADLWEGGHRVPFIVRWPQVVEAGSQSSALICLTDLLATAAECSGAEVPSNAGEERVSFVPVLQGKRMSPTRAGVVHHSISGHFAYRVGQWKLLLAKGSGGWTAPKEGSIPTDAPNAQLYDMVADPGETTNLYESHPEVAHRLLAQLEADVFNRRSTEG